MIDREKIIALAATLPDDLTLIAQALGYKVGLMPGSCDEDIRNLGGACFDGAHLGYDDMARTERYG